jgi:hypothetical protein
MEGLRMTKNTASVYLFRAALYELISVFHKNALFHFVLTHKSSLTCLSEIKSHVQLTKAIKWAITKKGYN